MKTFTFKNFKNLAIASLFVAFLSGCMTVTVGPGGGGGVTLTGEHQELVTTVQPWQDLVIMAPAVVHLYPQELGTVTVSGDAAVVERLVVTDGGGTLSIELPGGITFGGHAFTAYPLVVTVGTGNLQSVTAAAAATVYTQGILNVDSLVLDFAAASSGYFEVAVSNLEVTAAAAATIDITGSADSFTGDFSAASLGRLAGLTVQDAVVTAAAASTIQGIYVENTLNASAAAASTVQFRGNPVVTYTAVGASSVTGGW
ncbi:MAG: DUF2807 domain-containing protein [Defluviitaleaceae bacterium]|nr:DUF2807 domain-containing protein [Defluviitaleaceae bacterium]